MNWRGRPLVSHQVILELIAATRTRSGLRVQAELDQRRYPLGVRIADRELAACRCSATTGTGSGTTPCSPPPRNAPAINLAVRGPLTSYRRLRDYSNFALLGVLDLMSVVGSLHGESAKEHLVIW
jgi:hypothetical protein